ncbi:MAG: hypothetical protein ACJATN_002683 [Neolewinella sp.]|jgi:hypothetical protein
MSQRKNQLALFPRQQVAGGASGSVRQYPRRPFPTIAALVIDPVAGTIKRTFIRATATGIKSVFPIQRATFQEANGYRVYGTSQDWDKITNRTTLPGVQLSSSGPLLITGTNFTGLDGHTAEELMQRIAFCYTDATRSYGLFQRSD